MTSRLVFIAALWLPDGPSGHATADTIAGMGAQTYSFTAKVVGRLKDRINLLPENQDAFMDYLEREGLSLSRYCSKGACLISIRNPKFIDAAGGADRVRYSVKKLGKRLIGISLDSEI